MTHFLQELASRRNKASDRAVAGLTDILQQLQICSIAAQQARLPQTLNSLARLGPDSNRIAIKRLCELLAPPNKCLPDKPVKVERTVIKTEPATNGHSPKADAGSAYIKEAKHALPADGAHLLHSSAEDAVWDQMDPAAVRFRFTCITHSCVNVLLSCGIHNAVQAKKFRSQVAELKRKLDVLQSAKTADAEPDAKATTDQHPTPPQCGVDDSHSPSLKKRKPAVSDGFSKAVLQIVKRKLDSDYKLGVKRDLITQN